MLRKSQMFEKMQNLKKIFMQTEPHNWIGWTHVRLEIGNLYDFTFFITATMHQIAYALFPSLYNCIFYMDLFVEIFCVKNHRGTILKKAIFRKILQTLRCILR